MGVRGWIFHLCVLHLLNFEVCTWERGETQTLEQVWSTHVLVAQALGEGGSERCGLGQCRAVWEGDGRNALQRERNIEEKGKRRRQALGHTEGKKNKCQKKKDLTSYKGNMKWNMRTPLREREHSRQRVIYRQPWLVTLHLSPFFSLEQIPFLDTFLPALLPCDCPCKWSLEGRLYAQNICANWPENRRGQNHAVCYLD